jgi:hypothetical protein
MACILGHCSTYVWYKLTDILKGLNAFIIRTWYIGQFPPHYTQHNIPEDILILPQSHSKKMKSHIYKNHPLCSRETYTTFSNKCFSTVPLKISNNLSLPFNLEFSDWTVLDHFMSKPYHRWKVLVFILVPLQIFVLIRLSAMEPHFSFKFTQLQLYSVHKILFSVCVVIL